MKQLEPRHYGLQLRRLIDENTEYCAPEPYEYIVDQVYDEIEICPLNVYHIHLTKTENISDFGKLPGTFLFILLIAYFLSSGLFCIWAQVEPSLIAQSLSMWKSWGIITKTQNGCFTLASKFFMFQKGT